MIITKMMQKLSLVTMGAACITLGATVESAQALITHTPADRVPPVVVSPPFGSLAPNGEVGTAFINFGVDYSYGGVEGIFSDGDVLAFSGVNNAGVVDLLAAVDGRIVLPGTTTQGLTSLLSVEAGFSSPGDLLLEVFGTSGNLLASVINNALTGSTGRSLLSIDRGGVSDIAFFRVSTPLQDGFGVPLVSLEQPTATAIPTPALLPGLIGMGVAALRKRKQEQKEAVEV